MSSSKLVDQRVVEMKFDNSNFEKNVKTSMNTIENLKASLDFSAIEVATMTVISNITNKITDAATKLAKSLSIDNLTSGWAKYESKIKSVGTLLAQGFDSDSVNKMVEELSWFSDQTSYSFEGMLDSVTKFVTVNKDLELSSQAMMGIAEWAAYTNANATTATRSMQQFAQALGKGYIGWQDWQQAVLNTNMTSADINGMFADIAASMADGEKTLTKLVDGTYQTLSGDIYTLEELFTSTALTEAKWLTTDIFTKAAAQMAGAVSPLMEVWTEAEETLSKAVEILGESGRALDDNQIKLFKASQEARTFTDAMNAIRDASSSAWSSVWQSIFGDYEKSVNLWTKVNNELYNVFVSPIWNLSETLQEWSDGGGWDLLFSVDEDNLGAIWNLFYAVRDIINLIKDGWSKAFEFGSNQLFDFTKRLKEGSAYLRLSQESIGYLTEVLTACFGVLKIGINIVKDIIKTIKPLSGNIIKMAKNIAVAIVNAVTKIMNTIQNNKAITKIVEKIINLINLVANGIDKLLSKQEFTDFITKIIELVNKAFEVIGKFVDVLADMYSKFENSGDNILKGLAEGLNSGVGMIMSTITNIANKIIEWFNSILGIHSPSTVFEDSGKNIVEGLFKGISEAFKKFKDVLSKLVDTYLTQPFIIFKENLEDFNTAIFAPVFANMGKIIKAIADGLNAINLSSASIIETFKKAGEEGAEIATISEEKLNKIKENTTTIIQKIIDFVTAFVQSFNSVLGIVAIYVDKIINKIKEMFIKIKEKSDEYAKKLKEKNAVEETAEELKESYSLIEKIVNNIINAFKYLFNKIGAIIEAATSGEKNALTDFIDSFINVLKALFGLFKSTLPLVTNILKMVTKFVSKFNSIIEGFNIENNNRMLTAVYNLIESMINIIITIIEKLNEFSVTMADALKNQQGTNKILNFLTKYAPYIALGLLAAKLISDLSPLGQAFKMLKRTTYLLDSTAELEYAGALFLKAKAIQALAASLLVLAESFVLIGAIPTDALIRGGIVFGSISAILIATLLAISKFNIKFNRKTIHLLADLESFKAAPDALKEAAAVIIAMATAMLIIAVALKIVTNMLKPLEGETQQKAINRLLVASGILVGSMTIILVVLALTAKQLKGITKELAPTIVAVSASMAILTFSFKQLCKIVRDNSEQIDTAMTIMWKMLAMLGSALISLSILFAFLNKSTKKFESPNITFVVNVAKELIGISVAIGLLIGALWLLTKIIGSVDAEKFTTAWSVMKMIFVAVASLYAVLSILSTIKGKVLSTIQKAPGNLQYITASITGIAASIALLVAAFAALAFMVKYCSVDQIEQAFFILDAITAFVLLLTGLFMSLNKKGKIGNTANVSVLLLSVTVLITAMSGVLVALGYLVTLKDFDLGMGLFLLGGIMTLLTVFVAVLSKLAASAGKTSGMGKVILALTVTMLAMAGIIVALGFIAKMENTDLLKAIAVLGAIVVGMLVLILALNSVAKTLKGQKAETVILRMLPIMIILATILGSLIALTVLSKQADTKAMLVMTKMMIVMTKMIVALAVISTLGKKLDIGGVLKIALVLGILMTALATMAGIMILMKDTLNNRDAILNLLILLGGITLAIGALAFVSSKMGDFNTGFLKFAGAIAVICGAIYLFAAACYTFVEALIKLKEVNADDIVNGITAISDGITASMDKLAELLVNAAGLLVVFLTELLKKAIEFMQTSGKELIYSLIKLLVNTLVDSLIGTIKAIAERVPDIIDALEYLVKEIITALGFTVDEERGLVGNFTYLLVSIFLEAIYGIVRALKEGDTIKEIAQGIIDIIDDVLTVIGDNSDKIISRGLILLLQIIDGIGNAIYNYAGVITQVLLKFIKNIAFSILPALSGVIKEIFGNGKVGTKISTWFDNNIVKPIENSSFGSDLGQAFDFGLIEGMLENSDKVYDTANEILGKKSMVGGTQDAIDSHSPSRVAAALGAFYTEGLIIGLKSGEDDLYTESEKIGLTMTDAVSKVAEKFSNGIDENSFTITPVLDLSEIQNGITEANSMMNSMSSDALTPNINMARAISREFNSNKSINQGATSADINDLKDSIINNENNTEGMNVVFNITGNDPEEIAQAVDKVLRENVMRRNNTKGGAFA